MKIYIATSGSYSDYSMDAVFSSRKKAEAAIELLQEDSEIEEWTVDAIPADGRLPYWVRMHPDGNVESVSREHSFFMMRDAPRITCIAAGPYAGVYNCFVYARDEAHAVKIASEKRREWKALQHRGE